MKRIKKTLLALAVIITALCASSPMMVSADESDDEKVYEFYCERYTKHKNKDDLQLNNTWFYRVTAPAGAHGGLLLADNISSNGTISYSYIESSTEVKVEIFNNVTEDAVRSGNIDANTVKSNITKLTVLDGAGEHGIDYWYDGGYSSGILYMATNALSDKSNEIPIFTSSDALDAYIATGDTTGQINKQANYDVDHDFSQDTYNSDIPVPQLSHLSYTGFHVDNAVSTRDLEVYVKTDF